MRDSCSFTLYFSMRLSASRFLLSVQSVLTTSLAFRLLALHDGRQRVLGQLVVGVVHCEVVHLFAHRVLPLHPLWATCGGAVRRRVARELLDPVDVPLRAGRAAVLVPLAPSGGTVALDRLGAAEPRAPVREGRGDVGAPRRRVRRPGDKGWRLPRPPRRASCRPAVQLLGDVPRARGRAVVSVAFAVAVAAGRGRTLTGPAASAIAVARGDVVLAAQRGGEAPPAVALAAPAATPAPPPSVPACTGGRPPKLSLPLDRQPSREGAPRSQA
jgi:hypothetical protein